jgi:catechol-2,3-dioxygenase
MTETKRPRLVGLNHVALEVGDIEEALTFYGRLFTFELRGKNERAWRLSIWAINLSPFRSAVSSRRTMVAILD